MTKQITLLLSFVLHVFTAHHCVAMEKESDLLTRMKETTASIEYKTKYPCNYEGLCAHITDIKTKHTSAISP